jgi:hypothetical protein
MIGFESRISLEEGIDRTVRSFRDSHPTWTAH